jgi:hypothetical protein
MENWLVVQCVFAVTISIEYVLVVQVQSWFRHEFHVDRHGRIPFHNSNLKWAKIFRTLAVSVIILLIDMISIHVRECWQGLQSTDQNFNSLEHRSLHCILHELKCHCKSFRLHINCKTPIKSLKWLSACSSSVS